MKLLTAKGRTRVHTGSQLRAALEMTADQWARASANGLIPAGDRASGTYSGPYVDELCARREQLLAAIPDDLTDSQLQRALGLDYGQWQRARQAGLVPGPDRSGYWTRDGVADLIADPEAVRAAIPPHPLGTVRAAKYLAEATGLPVAPEDIKELARVGLTRVAGHYDGTALYDMALIRQIGADPEQRTQLAAIIDERQRWTAVSLDPRAAAARLGWSVQEFTAVAAERLEPGHAGRYACTAIDALAADEEVADRVRRARLVYVERALEHLELPRRTELDYLVAAGLIAPVATDLYRVADLEDLLQIDWIDWEALRCLRPGERSPLREYSTLPASRAREIRAFCAELSGRYAVAVWPRWVDRAERWEIDWEQRPDGSPHLAEVRAALRAHPAAAKHAGQVRLSTAVGDVIRWARTMLTPAAGVLVHATAGAGQPTEIAVVAADTGAVLLHAHGAQDPAPIGPERWVHELERLLTAPGAPTPLAYDDAVESAVRGAFRQAGVPADRLPTRWGRLKSANSTWSRVHPWEPVPLSGGALAVAQAERATLQRLARGYRAGPTAPRIAEEESRAEP